MAHNVQAFIARTELLQMLAHELKRAHVIPLTQGLALLPTVAHPAEFYDEQAGNEERKGLFAELNYLSSPFAEQARRFSEQGTIAYVETEYWGGDGEQAAIVWAKGKIVFGPARANFGTINEALRHLEVERGAHRDRFDAIGLGRYRDNDDWINQPL
jgi:hypothetical protein